MIDNIIHFIISQKDIFIQTVIQTRVKKPYGTDIIQNLIIKKKKTNFESWYYSMMAEIIGSPMELS